MTATLYAHDVCTCGRGHVPGPVHLGLTSCRICGKLKPAADTKVTPARGSIVASWLTSESPAPDAQRRQRERMDPESVWR